MKKGILFDVDGTLWDASAQVADSWNEVLEQKYPTASVRITAQDMRRNMGKTMTGIEDAFFGGLPAGTRRQVMLDCMEYENQYLLSHPGSLYPDAAEVLHQLSWHYELFIVSNCQRGYIETLMKAWSLEEYIRDTECFGNTGLSKGENIGLVIKRNHLDKCFYVGDTPTDQEAAELAGIPFVHAAYGYGTVSGAAAEIMSLRELLTIARTLLD